MENFKNKQNFQFNLFPFSFKVDYKTKFSENMFTNSFYKVTSQIAFDIFIQLQLTSECIFLNRRNWEYCYEIIKRIKSTLPEKNILDKNFSCSHPR